MRHRPCCACGRRGRTVTVELRDLKWAIVTSQHRSLRQAAQTLNIRQSTLSRRLRDLEYQLGAELFERTNGGTRPTTAGQEFLDTARRIIEDDRRRRPYPKNSEPWREWKIDDRRLCVASHRQFARDPGGASSSVSGRGHSHRR